MSSSDSATSVMTPMPMPANLAPGFLPGTAVHIGNLPRDLTEPQLYSLLQTAGCMVTTLRITRDNITKTSLGYAYANFATPEEATNAIAKLHNSKVGKNELRVSLKQSDPTIRRSPNHNLFVKGIPAEIKSADLTALFSEFGKLVSATVRQIPSKDNKDQLVSAGYGYVCFESAEACTKALEKLNGANFEKFPENKLHVERFQPSSQRTRKDVFTNLYYRGIPSTVSEAEVKAMFAKCGEIIAEKHRENAKYSARFGFVNFKTMDEAKKAIETLNGSSVGGVTISVERAKSKAEREREAKERRAKSTRYNETLLVRNIPREVEEPELRKLFGDFGEIKSLSLKRIDGTTEHTGQCFVEYNSADQADKAVQTLTNHVLRGKQLYIVKLLPKEARRSQQQMFQAQQMGMMPFMMMGRGPMGPAGPMRPGFVPPMYQGFQMPGQMGQMPPRMVQNRPQGQPGAPRYQQQPQMRGPAVVAPTARNVPAVQQPVQMPVAQQQPQPVAQPLAVPQAVDPAIAALEAKLSAAPDAAARRRAFGETIFPKISSIDKERAGKITGMLLELEEEELRRLIRDQNTLRERVSEAQTLLSSA